LVAVLAVNGHNLRVGLVQLNVTPSKSENLRNVINSLDSRLEMCDLVVFPECSMGYPKGPLTRKFVRANAESLDGDFVRHVAEKSKAKQLTVVLPIFEKAAGTVFNTAVVISKGRIVGGYRKIHLFDALGVQESDFFGAGAETVVFTVRDLTFGIITCYELRFPELMKKEVMFGARAVVVPAAWARGPLKEEQWLSLLMARAQENTSFMIGVGNANRTFIGRSVVMDPLGVKVMDLGAGDRIGFCEVDEARVKKAREILPLLKQAGSTRYGPCMQL
jgi:predicted amidohydrolase